MEQPTDEFIELVVTLAKEDNDKDNNNNKYKSVSKQQYKKYTIDKPEQVVSWLLFLIVKGTFRTIKYKAIQLLDRLLVKKGEEFADALSDEIAEDAVIGTEEILEDDSLTDTCRDHIFGIRESLSIYEKKVDEEEDNNNNNEEDDNEQDDYYEQEEEEEEVVYDGKEKIIFTKLLLTLSKSDGYSIPYRNSIERRVSHLIGMSMDYPSWLTPVVLQGIDTLINVLDRHSEKDFNAKSMVFECLFLWVKKFQIMYTDSHVERIFYHLYRWLTQVNEDVSLEEWTKSNKKFDKSGAYFRNIYVEERDYDNLPTEEEQSMDKPDDNDVKVTGYTAQAAFKLFSKAFGQHSERLILGILLNTSSWQDKYAVMLSLTNSCTHISKTVRQQFIFILRSVLNCFNDENVRVRWASLQCLVELVSSIQLSVDYDDLMVQFEGLSIPPRDEIFKVIDKSIQDPNESIQSSCCVLIKTMMDALTNHMNDDNVLDRIINWIQKLLVGLSKIYLVEIVLHSLISLVGSIKLKFKPYYKRFVPILFGLLEKHNGTRESRLLRSRVIKAFGKKTFDLNLDVLGVSKDLILNADKPFNIFLPMIIRMIVKVLKAPIPRRPEDITQTFVDNYYRILAGLKILSGFLLEDDHNRLYAPLAPLVQSIVDPLCNLVTHPFNTNLRSQSLPCVTPCLALTMHHFGNRSEKTLEVFGKILDAVVFHPESDIHITLLRVSTGSFLISAIGDDAMTSTQVQSVIDTFKRVEQSILVDHIGDQPDFNMINHEAYVLLNLYGLIEEMVKFNGPVAVPLITSELLEGFCQKLEGGGELMIKAAILSFFSSFCTYGGDVAINAFPHIVPLMIECLKLSDAKARQGASIALGAAAQAAKERFSPWVTQTFHVLDTMISSPPAFSLENIAATDYALSSICKIIRYVPQINNANVIIPKWLDHLLASSKRGRIILNDTLCTIIRLYPKECLGQQYQHVAKSSITTLIIANNMLKNNKNNNSSKHGMEQPEDDEFIEIVVVLAKVEQQKRLNGDHSIDIDFKLKSNTKQQFKDYAIDCPSKVVSWLLYFIVKGDYPSIKEKSAQLLDKLLEKEGEEYLKEISQPVLDAAVFEVQKILDDKSHRLQDGDFKSSLIGIEQSILNFQADQANIEDDDQDDDYESSYDDDESAKEGEEVIFMRVSGTRIYYIVSQIMAAYSQKPSLTKEIKQKIIDTFVGVLDKHRDNGFADRNIKERFIDSFMVMGKLQSADFTDNHIESIISHLYIWLAEEVKDVSLEEWTESDMTTEDKRYKKFQCFTQLFSMRGALEKHIFNQFNIFSNSQSWKDRYTSITTLSHSFQLIPHQINHTNNNNNNQQFDYILKSALKLVNDDEDIRVRWASLQCLIQLTIEYIHRKLMVKSRQEIFQAMVKSIRRDTNELIQGCCCHLIEKMMETITNSNIVLESPILDTLCDSFEILLQSPNLEIVESSLVSLLSVFDKVQEKFMPYSQRFIPILFRFLEKHHTTKESRALCSRVIKAFSTCSKVTVDKKMYSKYLYKFMVLVGRNQRSFDLVEVLRAASLLLVKQICDSFPNEIYLPMIAKMIVNVLETPTGDEMNGSSSDQDSSRIKSTLEILKSIMVSLIHGPYVPIAPFVHSFINPLRKLANNNTFFATESLGCLPACIKLANLYFGERSKETLEIFDKIYGSILCHPDSDIKVAMARIEMSANLIKSMGRDTMTIDQVHSTLDTFKRMEKWIDDIASGDQFPENQMGNVAYAAIHIYELMGELVARNSTIASPLIIKLFGHDLQEY
ncbi:hypothetical protein DFA_00479 [Cavenderia fasciculata]|uniref:HEAT repeat-containing protein n=1 Tax=Cavenderia fasciculata TaxID=261658 RepID=F4PS20_CACFS|nr:uncharacterized protein DFA_00479 [Cavenderia fasciculata]EGG20618.1 hypothetical protein DFA_00479 [Cavenderia fasciculata]|eukprot:XP_004358468.1 hypothetical protein DFA_00479 [Cavenderia fasciculata]